MKILLAALGVLGLDFLGRLLQEWLIGGIGRLAARWDLRKARLLEPTVAEDMDHDFYAEVPAPASLSAALAILASLIRDVATTTVRASVNPITDPYVANRRRQRRAFIASLIATVAAGGNILQPGIFNVWFFTSTVMMAVWSTLYAWNWLAARNWRRNRADAE